MNYVFADQEVQKLAEKPFNFVNWRDFAIALKKAAAGLPACYDVPQFEEPGSFFHDFNNELVRRLELEVGMSLGWGVEVLVRGGSLAATLAKYPISMILEAYPQIILAVTPKNK